LATDRTAPRPAGEALRDLAVAALHDLKAHDVTVIDARGASTLTDFVVVATGTSDRHLRALASSVLRAAKEAGVVPIGSEGEAAGEWVLVDLRDVVVHLMLPRTRAFYQLEKLWGVATPLTVGVVGR
jgi:ribosome-associated protein